MIHVLLTRTPLYSRSCPLFLVRLACVKRAASVDSEPGSNSRLNRVATRSEDPITDVLDRFRFELRLLTNFFYSQNIALASNAVCIASNQIFKDLRSWNPRSYESDSLPGLESRFGLA
jgi:hypothetical protein